MAEFPLSASHAPPSRPEFLPAAVDFESLPEPVRQALIDQVGPVYQELVAAAPTAHERSVGVALVLLCSLEVIDQFALAQSTDFTTIAAQTPQQRAAHDKRLRAHLRLASRKLRVAKLLFRLQRLREQQPAPALAPAEPQMARPAAEIIFSRNRQADDQHHQHGEPTRCQPPPLCAGPRSAPNCARGRQRCARLHTPAGLQSLGAVSRRRAAHFPRKKNLQNRRFADQQHEPRAGPE